MIALELSKYLVTFCVILCTCSLINKITSFLISIYCAYNVQLGSVSAVSGYTVNSLFLWRRGFGSKYKVPFAIKRLRMA